MLQLVGSCIFLPFLAQCIFCSLTAGIRHVSPLVVGFWSVVKYNPFMKFSSFWTCCPALPVLRCMHNCHKITLLCYRTKSGGGGGGDAEEEEEDE